MKLTLIAILLCGTLPAAELPIPFQDYSESVVLKNSNNNGNHNGNGNGHNPAVPEPATYTLIGAGTLAAVAAIRRRK